MASKSYGSGAASLSVFSGFAALAAAPPFCGGLKPKNRRLPSFDQARSFLMGSVHPFGACSDEAACFAWPAAASQIESVADPAGLSTPDRNASACPSFAHVSDSYRPLSAWRRGGGRGCRVRERVDEDAVPLALRAGHDDGERLRRRVERERGDRRDLPLGARREIAELQRPPAFARLALSDSAGFGGRARPRARLRRLLARIRACSAGRPAFSPALASGAGSW